MHELNCDGAFTHARGDAADGAVTDIAHREDTGSTGFKQARLPIEGPAFGTFTRAKQVETSEDEAMLVAGDRVP